MIEQATATTALLINGCGYISRATGAGNRQHRLNSLCSSTSELAVDFCQLFIHRYPILMPYFQNASFIPSAVVVMGHYRLQPEPAARSL
jgi:hypothetical protein